MRKGKIVRERLALFCEYEVEGLNLDRLLESLKKRGIEIICAKKTSPKRLFLTIKHCDNRKFFAILKEMWYNTYTIHCIREYGRDFPMFFFIKNVGLFLGICFFFTFLFYSNGYIYDFKYEGTGSILSREIGDYLNEKNVKRFTRFSDVDLKTLSDEILSNTDGITFCECERYGNRLIINTSLAKNYGKEKEKNPKSLIADVDGVIDEIKVYRGTPAYNVGDRIKVGDNLVYDFVEIKDKKLPVSVLAVAIIRTEKEFTFIASEPNREVEFEMLAENVLTEKNIIKTTTQVKKEGDGYLYTVKVVFKHKISAGE